VPLDMTSLLAEEPAGPAAAPRRQAYSYVRFSTPEQQKGDSFRRQTSMAQAYAAKHGLDLDENLTFHDVGVSGYRGRNAKAGNLAVFMEAVEAGQVPPGAVLLVEQLDRISRMEPLLALDVLRDIVKSGVSVVTLNDGREFTQESLNKNFTDLLVAVIVFVRANEESVAKSDRGMAFWSAKRAKAEDRPLTATTPEWVHFDKEAGTLVLIEDRAAIVRRIFEMTLQGVGVAKIAETFNREGLEPWGRGKRKASAWHRSYITRIVQNPAVIGAFTMHRTDFQDGKTVRLPVRTIDDYFPSVIDVATFEQANASRVARGDAVRVPRVRFPTQNILAGMTLCPKCGGSMVRVAKGGRNLPAYACSTAKMGKGCEYKSVRYRDVENRILQVLPNALRHRDGLAGGPDDLDGQLRNAEDDHYDLAERVDLLVQDLQAERDPAVRAILRERLAPMAADRNAAQERLGELRQLREQFAGAVLQKRIEALLAVLQANRGPELDRAAVNQSLRTVFSSATINYPIRAVDLEWRSGGTLRIYYDMISPEPFQTGQYRYVPDGAND